VTGAGGTVMGMLMRGLALRAIVVPALLVATGCAARASGANRADAAIRADAIRRASVWTASDVSRRDLRTGPAGAGTFAPNAEVECTYVDKDMSGNTPKFTCTLPSGDRVKVKYGADNGEVYAEVAATRLLWALGFGADAMYPVRVRCHGCPEDEVDTAPAAGGKERGKVGEQRATGSPARTSETGAVKAAAKTAPRYFAFAAIERKSPGRELEGPDGPGWIWAELDHVDPESGGASAAQRDGLKLLAAVLQHTDSKRQQQRIVCQDDLPAEAPCTRPFMLISDLGKTFGKANAFNRDKLGSVNLEAWQKMPVWADDQGCRAKLDKSLTGTLDNPVVSEGGRAFLADLLAQLTDRQLRDLFTVARFPARAAALADTDDEMTGEVRQWVAAFKEKVMQIKGRSCGTIAAAR
jgi:hypothetical protein